MISWPSGDARRLYTVLGDLSDSPVADPVSQDGQAPTRHAGREWATDECHAHRQVSPMRSISSGPVSCERSKTKVVNMNSGEFSGATLNKLLKRLGPEKL